MAMSSDQKQERDFVECLDAPRLATPAQSQGLIHARYSIPKRIDGAHEEIRAYFALYGSEADPTV
jgi:hypothetical protein